MGEKQPSRQPRSRRPAAPQLSRLAVEIPEDVNEFYVNSLNALIGPWDITLLFGSTQLPTDVRAVPSQVGGSARIDVALRMSPQHLKASLRVLESAVRQYEATFGILNIPEALMENIENPEEQASRQS